MFQFNLDKLEYQKGIAIIVSILVLFIPGYSFIFFVKREWFLTMDLIRLSLLALTVTFPLYSLNIAIELLKYDNRGVHKIPIGLVVILAAITTVMLIYMAIFSRYILNFTLNNIIWLMIMVETIFLFMAIYKELKYNSENKIKEYDKNEYHTNKVYHIKKKE